MNKTYDFIIYIGRFEPFHLGHKYVIEKALSRARHVITLTGSANLPSTVKNPWTFHDRYRMISASFPSEVSNERLIIEPLDDILYDDERWLAEVQKTLTNIIQHVGNTYADDDHDISQYSVAIIGHKKDDSSYYLDLFPSWDFIEVPIWGMVSATDVRDNYLQRAPIIPDHLCDAPTVNFLKEYMLTNQFRYLVNERESIQKNYIDKWKNAPYPPHFVTADAVVTQSGHILLVTRKLAPGAGLLALPGGHVNPNYGDAFDNCITELWQEARPSDGHSGKGKAMPKGALRRYYTGYERRFDKPGRDPRGYYCTHAFRFKFPDGKLWDVTGGLAIEGEENDVEHAAWYPISSLDPRKMFSDHYFIIQKML